MRELYVNEVGELYRYACSRPGVDGIGAEDLVQTAFQEAVLAWDKVGRLTVDGQRAWLRQVLKYKSIDDWRKGRVVDSTPDVPDIGLPQADPAELVVLSTALKACWALITRMSAVKQEVACLTWAEFWPDKRIAERMGITESRVRGHRMEMRARLRADVGHLVPFIDDDDEEGAGGGA